MLTAADKKVAWDFAREISVWEAIQNAVPWQPFFSMAKSRKALQGGKQSSPWPAAERPPCQANDSWGRAFFSRFRGAQFSANGQRRFSCCRGRGF